MPDQKELRSLFNKQKKGDDIFDPMLNVPIILKEIDGVVKPFAKDGTEINLEEREKTIKSMGFTKSPYLSSAPVRERKPAPVTSIVATNAENSYKETSVLGIVLGIIKQNPGISPASLAVKGVEAGVKSEGAVKGCIPILKKRGQIE